MGATIIVHLCNTGSRRQAAQIGGYIFLPAVNDIGFSRLTSSLRGSGEGEVQVEDALTGMVEKN